MRIDEIRSNPDKNIKVDILNALVKYREREDVYVSFTQINKLGINPNSGYATPLGIYAYPVKELFERYVRGSHLEHDVEMQDIVPFAGDQPHAIIFSCPNQTGLIRDFEKFTENDLYNAMDKLVNVITEWMGTNTGVTGGDVHENAEKMVYDYIGRPVARSGDTNPRSNSPIGLLWFATMKVASWMGDHRHQRGKDIVDHSQHSHQPKIWNALLRKIGFIGFVDGHGQSVIHSNEPMQAVFMSTASFKIIEVLDNTRRMGTDDNSKRETGLREYNDKKVRNNIRQWFFTKALSQPFRLPQDYDWAIHEFALIMKAEDIETDNAYDLMDYLFQRWLVDNKDFYEAMKGKTKYPLSSSFFNEVIKKMSNFNKTALHIYDIVKAMA